MDSETVLKWLNSKTARYHTFVANRVAEILEKLHPEQWRHVPGKLNPADDVSRGINPDKLTTDHRWFHGLEFLRFPEQRWPTTPEAKEPTDDEVVKEVVSLATVSAETCIIRTLFTRTQDWTKARKIVAYILRLRLRKEERPQQRWLTGSEIWRAEVLCLRLAQRESYTDELDALRMKRPIHRSSPLKFLSPGLDQKTGVLRVNGRLERSKLPPDARQPCIVPQNHPIATAIIAYVHGYLRHAPSERTWNEVLLQFWIPQGRALVHRYVGKCFECRRQRSDPLNQKMAPLPAQRLEPFLPAFHFTGIDYFGPITVSMFRRKLKRYGVLFTCLRTRAVHIEITPSMDVDSFLMAFWRFCNRRRYPAAVWTDNGTYFVAGDKEISMAFDEESRARLAHETLKYKMEWHFNPPYGPHHGGVWESLIKSAKKALFVILKDRTITDELLSTAMAEVEALLNSRPLTHVSVDPRDLEPITPNHFLTGYASARSPIPAVSDSDLSSRKRWRMLQMLMNHFWKRWLKEYLPRLHSRQKWVEENQNLKPGSTVLVIDENTTRGQWQVGRVLEVFPGKDDLVRVARILTKSGEYTRPITKLCLLEQSD